MLEMIQAGLGWVLAAQSLGPQLSAPMAAISELGTESFYLLIMPIVLWCYDYALGLRLALILVMSAWSNVMLKLTFASPRPFWISADVRPLSFESSFGFPSGHAQNSVSIWGRLAHGLRRGWAYAAAVGLILLISFSRLYLGVHFPLDVLGGWLAGSVLLLVFISLEEPIWKWFKRREPLTQMAIIVVASMLTLYLGITLWGTSLSRTLPTEWIILAARAAPSDMLPDPRSLEPLISIPAVMLGLVVGAWQLQRSGGYHAGGQLKLRAVRFILGTLGVAVLFFGLDLFSPPSETLPAYLWRYLRYGLVGYWISFLAPRTFRALGLAEPAIEVAALDQSSSA